MIIFLNGPGSSGKTSIAKAIQHISQKPWLILSMDSFIDMMPADYVGFGSKASEGVQFIAEEEDGKPVVRCKTGELGNKIFRIIPAVAKLMADAGLDFIIDEVLFGDEGLQAYAQAFSGISVYFIGVKCGLEAMEEREVLRGDRAIGLSRDQVNMVHEGLRPYDLVVDTTYDSPFACARQILSFIDSTPSPQGFHKTLPKSS